MAHLQYMPGDPRLVDQLVYELKSKGIFDQFRKECIADVDTRPAYQNLRQRVETSVSSFLSRQTWKPDLNKNQLREKLRKHILDGNYLEQGVERIVDQVVHPKVPSVFIPQVEDLVYNYLGLPRKKAPGPETSEQKPEDLLPTDLEAVSPGSVNDDKHEFMDTDEKTEKMDIDYDENPDEIEFNEDIVTDAEKNEKLNIQMHEVAMTLNVGSLDKISIPLPTAEINLESIPAPINSPPKAPKVELDSIALPHDPDLSTDIPLPDEAPKEDSSSYFKPIQQNSEESNSSSDSSLRRNMSPLTPIRNFNNENSCDAQQGFDDNSNSKCEEKSTPSTFRFTIETKDEKIENSELKIENSELKVENSELKTENSELEIDNSEIKIDNSELKIENKEVENSEIKPDKKEVEQTVLSYQFNNQLNINTFNTPLYDDSSNSNNLHIDYESDVNSKTNTEIKPEIENSLDSKKEKKTDERKSSHKSSHRSRDSSRHSSSKDKRSESKQSTSRDSSRHNKKSSTKDDKYKSSKDRDRSKDRNDKKDSRDSSKQRSSHKSSSKDKDYKSHRSSSSSHRHSSKSVDDKKSSSSKESSKDKISESSRDKSSKDKESRSKDSKSSSHRSDKDRKSSSSSKKSDDKDKKRDKKDVDDHYSSSGRGNHSRRSTDRDSNDGSSSSKGSQNQNGAKSSGAKKESKSGSSKSENTSTSGDSPSPSDKDKTVQDNAKMSQSKPIVRVDNHLETPIATPPRLPFVPDVTLKKPRFAANLQEAKKLMKMRKFLDEEQKRMNQEAALLLEFQANVRPSLSQVYSSIPGPELEFACVTNSPKDSVPYEVINNVQSIENETNIKDESGDLPAKDIPGANKVIEVEDTKSQVEESNIPMVLTENKTIDVKGTEEIIKHDNPDSPEQPDENDDSYEENKPFSELMNEITEYSKASENKVNTDNEESTEAGKSEDVSENCEEMAEITDAKEKLEIEATVDAVVENKYFEVTIITEELSETEEIETDKIQTKEESIEVTTESLEEIQIDTENTEPPKLPDTELLYFAEHEKYSAELTRHEFSNFLKNYMENLSISNKMHLINCDTYEENIFKEMAATFGDFEVINYYKNGHLKLPNTSKNIVKDVKLSAEITLPLESYENKSPLFSPIKSECSFELSSDYDTKLEDINKKSRQEVMEIILGSIIDASPGKMPKIGYYTECTELDTDVTDVSETDSKLNSVESGTEDPVMSRTEHNLKRRIHEIESSINNNRSVLTSNKIRKLSDSDQISSTTEETEEVSNNNKVPNNTRSKYLGRARRVGLPRPKRCNLANSPSSDKSVENYLQNTPTTPNGKMKPTPRSKVQRYDTADLYKPKLHYLSRRNNVS